MARNYDDVQIGGQCYTIRITEQQRQLLHQAVALTADPRACHYREIVALANMLARLPTDEKETPGALHGFAL